MAEPRREPDITHLDEAGRPRMAHTGATGAEARLSRLFQRNGYVRVPHNDRRQRLGQKYKKGWEVRLVLGSLEELEETRRLLEEAGLKPGRAFKKFNQYAQPVYGKRAVDLFSRWAASDG